MRPSSPPPGPLSGSASGPLAGVKVLDLSSVVVGPACTLALADQGAEVVKVEPPEGDLMRQLGGGARTAGMTGKFMNFNRNKRSICLDLRRPEGLALVHRLAAEADILVTNMRPSALERLGLDWPRAQALNPRLIHCLILGFGRGGPYYGKPAYDTVIQSVSGVSGAFAQSTGQPQFAPFVMCDHITGLTAAQAIGFALFRRERTGCGEAIEIPMFENMAAFVLREHMGSMTFEPPVGPPGDSRILNPESRPVPTADGYLALSPNNNAQAFAFFEVIGRPELKTDPRFCSVEARVANSTAYAQLRATALRGKTTAEWLPILEQADIPAAPYNSLESLVQDPHLAATGFIAEVMHPSEGTVRQLGIPARFSGGMREDLQPAPRLGEHSLEVLRDWGVDEALMNAALEQDAVIDGQANAHKKETR